MASKRVHDVSSEYPEDATRPASNDDIARIKRYAVALKTGKLERDVDTVLSAKGLKLDEPLGAPKKAPRRLR